MSQYYCTTKTVSGCNIISIFSIRLYVDLRNVTIVKERFTGNWALVKRTDVCALCGQKVRYMVVSFAPVIIRVFIVEEETVRFGIQFLRARCFATPLMFLCFSMVHFTQAIGRGKESFWLAVIRQLIFQEPYQYKCQKAGGKVGVYVFIRIVLQ